MSFKQGVEGQVKWFSNRKGFGFIAATDGSLEEEIFVHQTGIVTDGHFRTLQENANVKFDVDKEEETGKLKAVNVTNTDGSPIAPPPRKPRKPRGANRKDGGEEGVEAETEEGGDTQDEAATTSADEEGGGNKKNNKKRNNGRRNNKEKESNNNGTAAANANGTDSAAAADGGGDAEGNAKPEADASKPTSNRPPRDPPFHMQFKDEVRSKIESERGVTLGTRTTIDVAMAPHARIKLGQGGYAGMCLQTAIIGEGSYTADEEGTVTLKWDRAIKCEEGEWKAYDPDLLMKTFSMLDEHVGPVQPNETAETLWGADKPDPREAFEANGFSMRRVVLTRPPNYRGGSGYRRHKRSQRNKPAGGGGGEGGGGEGGEGGAL